MTPEEVRHIIQLLQAGYDSGASIQATVQSIQLAMPHLAAADIAEACQVHAEESKLDAAVLNAQAQASKRIAEIILETNEPNLEGALKMLAARSGQGDGRATKMLVELQQLATVIGMENGEE